MSKEEVGLDLSNTRIDRLSQVITALEQHKPLNLGGPIAIVAPRAAHRVWKHAIAEYRKYRTGAGRATGRYIMVMDPKQFREECEPSAENAPLKLFEQADWVFVIDDQFPEHRPIVIEGTKRLNLTEQRHRLFMTAVLNG
ncbi:hypothetical protein BcepSauron_103 [Burkholderia phage BcepSauron]|uniref:Uncharacterized protein n=1 Tax=Burkholderia phage BcepSauron TaxID=2530033 RepID=A0A482MMV0_9CAUD|nr:hypothetical protein H1O17_gp103 [Burkholderia phage BcepSauron]QBQ74483.1 hypothetical protein BcepSauron_103 [Burkholderia phage BcepSauron]